MDGLPAIKAQHIIRMALCTELVGITLKTLSTISTATDISSPAWFVYRILQRICCPVTALIGRQSQVPGKDGNPDNYDYPDRESAVFVFDERRVPEESVRCVQR